VSTKSQLKYTFSNHDLMPDQATLLRELMGRQTAPAVSVSVGASHVAPRTLAIASGKGGVGKSHIALNLSIALAEFGHSVCVLDANENSSHLELLSGGSGYWNLSHVVSGARTIEDVALAGPGGIRILSAAGSLLTTESHSQTSNQVARQQCAEYLGQFDYLVIDTPTGNSSLTQQILSAADSVWMVTVPELTAIAETYSLMKICLQSGQLPDWEILVNQADSAFQARQIVNRIRKTTQSFLCRDVFPAGFVPYDQIVCSAAMQSIPFCHMAPDSVAARAVGQLAKYWSERSRKVSGEFLQKLSAF
jgi:flagellar biosynthesis protein FlhG